MQPKSLLLGETLSLVVPKQGTLDLSHAHRQKTNKRERSRDDRCLQKHSVQETGEKSICIVIRRLEREFSWLQTKTKGMPLIDFLDSAGGNVRCLIILCEKLNQRFFKDSRASQTNKVF